jgi:GMC oxidoreductase
MTFNSATYENFVSTSSATQLRLFPQYQGSRTDFDIVIIGSGMGGGVLADDLADRLGAQKRILVLEAGSFLFPTHVYNVCRFPNADVARNFACKTFWQPGDGNSQYYIHERPQLNFGGRSIFWSGLIPTIQPWELEFFPPQVRQDLAAGLLTEAGTKMNQSASMGGTARAIVNKLRQSPLAQDFDIQETPRAIHQPYLTPEGVLSDRNFIEPTGVFNTAELLINQVGLMSPGVDQGDGSGMHILLNHYVEDVQSAPGNGFQLVTRNTLDGQVRIFQAGTVVLAGGSIESPKLLRRSSLFHSLPDNVKSLVGRGLTDHPTTDWIDALATNIGDVPIPKDSHAKIVFYSRGRRDPQNSNQILYPFNVEMNINHEYWHLRENDPSASTTPINNSGASLVQIKFSFGNCLDSGNEVKPAPSFGYVPEIAFKNLNWMDDLAGSRFPALAGWQKDFGQIFAVLNDVTYRIFSQFQHHGSQSRPVQQDGEEVWYGQKNKAFGRGTVHHAVGTLRMPHRAWHDGPVQFESVVDEDLRIVGTQHLYVCDMSVMPFSSAANPVRTLVALALRLSKHFG